MTDIRPANVQHLQPSWLNFDAAETVTLYSSLIYNGLLYVPSSHFLVSHS